MKRQPLTVALPFRYRPFGEKAGASNESNEMRFYFVAVSLLPLSGNVGRSHP
jgi:hypothetical protein